MVGGGDSEGCERAGEWSFIVASAGLEVECMASRKIQVVGAHIIDGYVGERCLETKTTTVQISVVVFQQERKSRYNSFSVPRIKTE